ncbi:3-hydroxybutyryl-CoA dehydrogenase [Paraburkholderia saeva]|uniref:L-gulonate 3-dehydrogenase n=1 Tax=Paraburkholderia saeva TaxID=2777537 RepID=A0A9N8X208_9BURK|nr:3-hydroxybutyryl-CoA dehydrogenase [Paraburkholderia saeva]CAG4897255.1 3-hydroxybutyryl-CoA dehydrogenase [Paraburkholderia saeva]CAG4913918.1 3-hydroxybutyryl-CoA dehydrogenase [Paraburkholderia saeva]CAG4919977.1 3-hydroxybutyryl-CoA dehydrogenase [Paraburkholderia saeva]
MSAADAIQHVDILGAGRMGQGMALAFAYAGLHVTLIDFKERDVEARIAFAATARGDIVRQLQTQVAFGRIKESQAAEVMARIAIVDRDRACALLPESAIVFEAVPEVMEAKEAAFAWLCNYVRADTVIASTTSTFLVTELQRIITHPARVLNAHWLNPAHLMPLVELSRSDTTDEAVVQRVVALLRRIGKVPVVCAPSAGYIVPRIQALAMNEAARMVEEGVASAEDIDTAIRTGFGLRFSILGLLEFIDWGGCDILYYASHYLARAIDPRFAPPQIVSDHMREGRDGLRDARGFYDYADVDVPAYLHKRLGEFGKALDNMGLAPAFNAALLENRSKADPQAA